MIKFSKTQSKLPLISNSVKITLTFIIPHDFQFSKLLPLSQVKEEAERRRVSLKSYRLKPMIITTISTMKIALRLKLHFQASEFLQILSTKTTLRARGSLSRFKTTCHLLTLALKLKFSYPPLSRFSSP